MLDAIDRRILEILQDNGRISNTDLAEQINLSPTPCLKRVKKLEKLGVITGYKAIVDLDKTGLSISGLVLLKLSDSKKETVTAFGEAIKKISAITECHMTTGRIDYVAKIHTKDFHDYENLVKEELADLPSLLSMETLFLFGTIVPEDAADVGAE